MSLLSRVHEIFGFLFRRRRFETDLHDEIDSFYETMVERYVGRGIPEAEARRMARLAFGHPENVKERVRDSSVGYVWDAAIRNVLFALRLIKKAPGHAAVIMLTLGIGIGANVTVFSVVSRFALHHPPVKNPASLMAIYTTQGRNQCCNNFSWLLYQDLREYTKSFSGIAAYYDLLPASIAGSGEAERVWGQAVTANFFDISSLPMELGRGFTAGEQHAQAVVISDRLWRRSFASDPGILGRSVRLSGRPYTVVGVAPRGFRGLDIILDAQFWVPLDNIDQLLPNTANRTSRNYHWLAVVGRIAPDVTTLRAEAELRLLGARFAKVFPQSVPAAERDTGFQMEPAGSLPPRDRTTMVVFLAALLAVAMLVLGIACANVINLSIAQANDRRREIAVRLALGAAKTLTLADVNGKHFTLARRWFDRGRTIDLGNGSGRSISVSSPGAARSFSERRKRRSSLCVRAQYLRWCVLWLGTRLVSGASSNAHFATGKDGEAAGTDVDCAQHGSDHSGFHVSGASLRHGAFFAQPGSSIAHRDWISFARHFDDVD